MHRNTKVLVVDDFATMRTLIRNQLRDLGFTDVDEADDGGTALPLLQRERFGLVITGWNMRVMQGIDLVRAIRADASLSGLPVLMVTAEARREQIIAAIEAGVNDYIIKPFQVNTLEAKIKRICERVGAPA